MVANVDAAFTLVSCGAAKDRTQPSSYHFNSSVSLDTNILSGLTLEDESENCGLVTMGKNR